MPRKVSASKRHPERTALRATISGRSGVQRSQRRLHLVGRGRSVFVLPDPEDRPATGSELCLIPPVAVHVRLELRPPEVAIALRGDGMLGTPVPEATVHIYRQACTRKDHVGCTSHVRVRCTVNSITQAARM